MDLGPQWPFDLQSGLAAIGALLLAWVAGRHGRRTGGWRQVLPGLLFWFGIALLCWEVQDPLCRIGWRVGVGIPGCNWEYQPAPTEAAELARFIVLGTIAQLLRLGSITVILSFACGYGIRRLRRQARQPAMPSDGVA